MAWVLGAALLWGSTACCLAQEPVDIGATAAQKTQLKAVAAHARHRSGRLHGELRRARANLVQLYSNYALDDQKAKAAMEDIGRAQVALLNMHLDNQIAVRKILDQNQYARFWRIMRKKIQAHHSSHREDPTLSFVDRLTDPAIIAGIGASPDQMRRLRAMPGKEKSLNQLKRDSDALLSLYGSYNFDAGRAKTLLDSIHQDQVRMSALTYRNQKVLRLVLTRDQFDKLKNAVQSRMHSAAHTGRIHPNS